MQTKKKETIQRIIKEKYNKIEQYLVLCTVLLNLESHSDEWTDVLVERDWSILRELDLSNYGNTQFFVKSLMILTDADVPNHKLYK